MDEEGASRAPNARYKGMKSILRIRPVQQRLACWLCVFFVWALGGVYVRTSANRRHI